MHWSRSLLSNQWFWYLKRWQESWNHTLFKLLGNITNTLQLGCEVCLSCHENCATCTGPSNTQCPTCKSGFYRQPSSKTCLSTCPLTYTANDTTRTCTKVVCHTFCSTCTGTLETECTACKTEYYLQPSPNSNTCADSCPATNYYANSSTNKCESNRYYCHSKIINIIMI